MNKRIIVFAPHPDDETLGCGGTIAKRLKEGYEVMVVLMTDGSQAFSGVLGIDTDPSPERLREIRRDEVRRAMRMLNVKEENLLFLDFEDESLEKNEEKAKDKVMEILNKNQPSEVYFPYEKDSHPDHRATNHIVRNSIKKLRLSVKCYRYSIMQKYGRVGPLIDAFLNLFRHDMIHRDISVFLPIKKMAIQVFYSEFFFI